MTDEEVRELWGDETIDALDLGTYAAVLEGDYP